MVLWSFFLSSRGSAMRTWRVSEAKARFGDLIERAGRDGSQLITRHGLERAVVLSIEDYRALAGPVDDFKTYLASGPKFDDFEIERSRDLGRTVEI